MEAVIAKKEWLTDAAAYEANKTRLTINTVTKIKLMLLNTITC